MLFRLFNYYCGSCCYYHDLHRNLIYGKRKRFLERGLQRATIRVVGLVLLSCLKDCALYSCSS